MLAAVVIFVPMSWAGLLDFDLWSLSQCKRLLAISFFYVANTALSLRGLQTLNIPMCECIEHLTAAHLDPKPSSLLKTQLSSE